jgi:hypothetical protein
MISKITLLSLVCVANLPFAEKALSASSTQNFNLIQSFDGKYFLYNNGYSFPSGASISQWMDNQNNPTLGGWGGSWDFKGKTGAMCPGTMIKGKWLNLNNTSNSQFPLRISSNSRTYSAWNHNVYSPSNDWQSFWEIWVHTGSNVSDSNVTCDIMVHPTYGNTAKTIQNGQNMGDVTLDGQVWTVVYQFAFGYEIIHFYRKNKTSNTTILCDAFWDYCAFKGWCSSSDWVGCVSSSVEAFSSSGYFTTSGWQVNSYYP